MRLVQVAAGAAHSLALSDEGDVYAWGSDAIGNTLGAVGGRYSQL